MLLLNYLRKLRDRFVVCSITQKKKVGIVVREPNIRTKTQLVGTKLAKFFEKKTLARFDLLDITFRIFLCPNGGHCHASAHLP